MRLTLWCILVLLALLVDELCSFSVLGLTFIVITSGIYLLGDYFKKEGKK